ncbi:hypothetical protein [Burkholderia sp. WP9]|uniref:hypothetical protein n=1 Tax=Burkholderia sp. WP9 TaxID=1500263 RepID=UPI000B848176|nr:hypothetical protein [Burkholderia sp. WP9]
MQVTDVRAVAVIPYVQPRIIEKDETVHHAGLDNFAYDLVVDERAGTLIRENDLYQGAETQGDITETHSL